MVQRGEIMNLLHVFFKILIILIAVIIFLLIYSLWDTKRAVVTNYSVASEKIPSAFNQYRILQLSDLHGQSFGNKQEMLLKHIASEKPNLIVISGDSLDRNHSKWEMTCQFIKDATQYAPVYVTLGNHESIFSHRDAAIHALRNTGAILLENENAILEKNGTTIVLSGISDPKFFNGSYYYKEALSHLIQEQPDSYHILISHRPELQKEYALKGYDLTFAGHAHGGQVQIPFVGGLIAPHQGLFPKLTKGVHDLNGKKLVISRGLGNQYYFPRVLNTPEIVVVTLQSN